MSGQFLMYLQKRHEFKTEIRSIINGAFGITVVKSKYY